MLRRSMTPAREQRALTSTTLFASGVTLSTATSSGVTITQETALKVNACYAAVRLISDVSSMLPVDTYIRRDGQRRPYRPKPAWVESPDPDGLTRAQFYTQWLVSKLTSHAACVRIIRDTAGDVVALSVLDPRRVIRQRNAAGTIEYVIDGGKYTLNADEVIYDSELIPPGGLMGLSRVDLLKETFGLTQALEVFAAAFFGNGTTMSGVIEVPSEVTKEQAESIQDGWEKGHKGLRRAHRPGILSGGAKWVKTSVAPDEAQMIQAREFAVEEVARAFRIAPSLLGSQKPGSVAYASREQDALQFVTYTLLPYLNAIELHLGRLLPGDVFIKFTVDSLLRASLADRYAAYSTGIQSGFLSINDIHRTEDMAPVDGGDEYRVPLANVNLSAANITEDDMKVSMASKLINVGFEPNDVLSALNMPAIGHTGLPPVQVQPAPQADMAPPTDAPTRTVRKVERDANGYILRIVDEPEETP